jgi:hypothetical protein
MIKRREAFMPLELWGAAEQQHSPVHGVDVLLMRADSDLLHTGLQEVIALQLLFQCCLRLQEW